MYYNPFSITQQPFDFLASHIETRYSHLSSKLLSFQINVQPDHIDKKTSRSHPSSDPSPTNFTSVHITVGLVTDICCSLTILFSMATLDWHVIFILLFLGQWGSFVSCTSTPVQEEPNVPHRQLRAASRQSSLLRRDQEIRRTFTASLVYTECKHILSFLYYADN